MRPKKRRSARQSYFFTLEVVTHCTDDARAEFRRHERIVHRCWRRRNLLRLSLWPPSAPPSGLLGFRLLLGALLVHIATLLKAGRKRASHDSNTASSTAPALPRVRQTDDEFCASLAAPNGAALSGHWEGTERSRHEKGRAKVGTEHEIAQTQSLAVQTCSVDVDLVDESMTPSRMKAKLRQPRSFALCSYLGGVQARYTLPLLLTFILALSDALTLAFDDQLKTMSASNDNKVTKDLLAGTAGGIAQVVRPHCHEWTERAE